MCIRDSRERLVHGPVVGAEGVEPVPGRAVAEHEVAARRLEGCDAAAEKLAQALLGAPERGRLDSRSRGDVAPDQLEHLADQARGGPVREADLAAGLAY